MDDNDELTAERILEERLNEDNQLQYLIKWEGEDEEYATWESYDEVTQSWPHLLHQFNHNKRKKDIIVLDHDDEYPSTSYYPHPQLAEYDVPSHSSTSTTSTTALSPTIRYNSRSSSSTCHRYNALPQPPPSTPPVHHAVIKPKLKPIPMAQPVIQHTNDRRATSAIYVKTEPIPEQHTVKRAANSAAAATLRMKQERDTMHTNHVPAPLTPSLSHNESAPNAMNTSAKHDDGKQTDVPKDIQAVEHHITVQNITNIERITEEDALQNAEMVYKPTLQLDFDVHHNEIAHIQEQHTADDIENTEQQEEHKAQEEHQTELEHSHLEQKTDGNDPKQQTDVDTTTDINTNTIEPSHQDNADKQIESDANHEDNTTQEQMDEDTHCNANHNDSSAVESKPHHEEPHVSKASASMESPKQIEKDVAETHEDVAETHEDAKDESEISHESTMPSFEMQEEPQLQSNDHPLMMNDTNASTSDETNATQPEPVMSPQLDHTKAKESIALDVTETVNQHNSESEDTHDTESIQNHDSDQAQAPSITLLTATSTSHTMVDDNVNLSDANSSTASPTSTVSPSTNRQFQDHLPSLSNNPSMADPGHHHHGTPNPSIIQPHYLSSQPPNNAGKPQPHNPQYTLLHLGQQPTFGPHEINSFHSLYIPPSAHHHIDSTMDSNSEYNHQSINTDSTNSSQTQTHSTIHSSTANQSHHHSSSTTNISITTNPPNPPTHGIFMPSINPPTTLHRHGSSHAAPPPHAPIPPIPPVHQLTHFSTVPVVTRIPLPMAGSCPPPTAHHPVLLSPANANGVTEETQQNSNEYHHSSGNASYYNESANQPQSSSNSINSLSQQCSTYNSDNFQNVDFQQIKANGAPFDCPFCDTVSFGQWADWKQHWYEFHNSKYFDDAQKLKTQGAIKSSHKLTDSVHTSTTFHHSNLLSLKSTFPPHPTNMPNNMVFQPSDAIQFQLQSVHKSSNDHNSTKKRNHESITNAQDDEFAPRAKRQKTSHSSYKNGSGEDTHHKKVKKQQEQDDDDDDDYVVSQDEDDNEDEEDEEEEDDDGSSTDSERRNHKKRKHHRRNHRSVKKKIKAKKAKKKTILLEVKKKRGRGRPRKNENIRKEKTEKAKPKRKRGRPRKYAADYEAAYYRSTRSKRQKLNAEERIKHPKAAVCCKICNVNCTNNAGLSNHIRARHGMGKLRDYFAMNERAIKDKQNEMHYNDTNRLIGISPTHKSKNIKYKYKCTVCDPETARFCAGHVGLNSHLRAHVKNGDVSETDQKKLYKQIMKNPIPIYAATPITNTAGDEQAKKDPPRKICEKTATKTVKSAAAVDKPSSFKHEVIGDEEEETTDNGNATTNDEDDDDDDDDEPRRKLRSIVKPKQIVRLPAKLRLPSKESENTPPFPMDEDTELTKQPSTAADQDRKKHQKNNLKSLSNIGRIPKKTPEQQKQQQMMIDQQSNILYPQRQKREFSPPDSPAPNNSNATQAAPPSYGNKKYRTSSHYSSADRQSTQPSHSRSSSSHSSHSRSYREGKYRNNHSRNSKNRRSSKYNNNRSNHYYRGKNGDSTKNASSNPLYPDNYPYRPHKMSNDDHHNVPALQPLHSPKHSNSHSMRKSSSQRHYYDNAHYKYNKNDGAMNGDTMTYDDHEVKTPSSANSGTTTDDIIT
eukprot:620711_1